MRVLPVVLIGVGVYAAWKYSEFQNFKNSLNVRLSKISFDFNKTVASGFRNIFLNVTVTLNNPSQFTTTMQSLKMAASYKGKEVGSIANSTAINLKSGEQSIIVPMALSTVNLFNSITDAYNALVNKTAIELKLVGNAMVGNFNIPINQTLKVS